MTTLTPKQLANMRYCLDAGLDVQLTRGVLRSLLAERDMLEQQLDVLRTAPADNMTGKCGECGADPVERDRVAARMAALVLGLRYSRHGGKRMTTGSLWSMPASRDPSLDGLRVRPLTKREITRIKREVAAMRKRDEQQLAPFHAGQRICPWCWGCCG